MITAIKKNLKPLLIIEQTANFTNGTANTPAPIVMRLYGKGENPAIMMPAVPCLIIKFSILFISYLSNKSLNTALPYFFPKKCPKAAPNKEAIRASAA